MNSSYLITSLFDFEAVNEMLKDSGDAGQDPYIGMFGMYSIGFRVKLLEYCTKYLFPKKTHFTCTTKYIYKIILRKNQNIDNNNNNNNVILKNRNETNVSAACSASGDVNNRRSFGV